MSKKLIYLISFVLVLCLVETSKAHNIDLNTSDGFDLYLDGIAPNIINTSWFDKGILDYNCRDNPASGNYCIHWAGVGQYSAISFRFVPAKDLKVLVNEGYVIDFWVRCNSPDTRIDIRFVDTKTNGQDHPWRMLYTVDGNVAVWDGRWKHLQIPLSEFSEKAHGMTAGSLRSAILTGVPPNFSRL